MSIENLWDEDENSIVDMPDEAKLDANGNPLVSPPVALTRPTAQPQAPKPTPTIVEQIQKELEAEQNPIMYEEEDVEEQSEEVEEEVEEEDYSEELRDASLRLEQGNLYKMLLDINDLFDGVKADPRAVKNVQREIRQFAKEKMEIMLGMRKETSTVEHLDIDFPFNAVEVTALRAVARAASGGASEQSDRYVPRVTRTTEEVETAGEPPRKTLKPLGNRAQQRNDDQNYVSPPPQRSFQSKVKVTEVRKGKPIPRKAPAPVQRGKLDQIIDREAAAAGISRELLELDDPGLLKKPFHELTDQEKLERNRLISSRRTKQVPSSNALPPATYEQQEALARSMANTVATSKGDNAQILDLLLNKK